MLARSIAALVALAAVECVQPARAQDFWQGGVATNPTWNQGSNWNLGVPFATYDVVFPAAIPAVPGATITLTNGEVANSLAFGANYHLTGGTLQLNAGSNVFSGIVAVAPGAVVTIDSALVGPNSLTYGTTPNFGGGGTLILNGQNTYTGNTYIQMGTFVVNGSLASPLVSVSHGATLAGLGTLAGNVVNSGAVSPGDAPGTLHIGGYYQQNSNGLLAIGFSAANGGSHSLLQVGGTATLDGTLALVRLDNFKLKRNDPVTILTASGGVVGKFAAVESNFTSNSILQPTLIYRSNSVQFEAVQGSFGQFAAGAGLTQNQRSVANALDSAANDRRANALFDYIDYRSLNKLPGDLDRIAPEELTSLFTLGMSLANVQSFNIQRRNADVRSGASGFNAANLSLNGDNPSYSGGFGITTGVAGPNGNDGKEVKETKQVVAPENRWGAFLSGTGEWVSVGSTDNARGYDLTSGGFTLGVDYKVTPNFAIGIAAGYTGTSVDLTEGGRLWVNGGKLGLYATVFQNAPVTAAPTMSKDSSKESKEVQPPVSLEAKGFYADMAAFGGYNSYDSRRAALQGDARGDTDGGEFDALFDVGYDLKLGGFTFGPTGSFNYTYMGTSAFTEHGSLAPLDVHGGDAESLRTAFGLKASYDFKCGGILIKPEVRAAWQHEYGDAAYALDSSFASGAGDSFLVNGPQIGRDSALIGAGFAIQCSERFSTYFYYDGELGRKNYQATNVSGGFRFAF